MLSMPPSKVLFEVRGKGKGEIIDAWAEKYLKLRNSLSNGVTVGQPEQGRRVRGGSPSTHESLREIFFMYGESIEKRKGKSGKGCEKS